MKQTLLATDEKYALAVKEIDRGNTIITALQSQVPRRRRGEIFHAPNLPPLATGDLQAARLGGFIPRAAFSECFR